MSSAEIQKEKARNEDLFNPCIVFHDGKNLSQYLNSYQRMNCDRNCRLNDN